MFLLKLSTETPPVADNIGAKSTLNEDKEVTPSVTFECGFNITENWDSNINIPLDFDKLMPDLNIGEEESLNLTSSPEISRD